MIYRIEPTENGLLVHGPSRGPSTLRPLGDEQFGGDSLELQFRRLQGGN